ncbi:MAG: hypothetical protein E7480_04335 [Ruminococcaceae bacterium]|nr:hypothetical protein [Oscillospiraceae bacterium]
MRSRRISKVFEIAIVSFSVIVSLIVIVCAILFISAHAKRYFYHKNCPSHQENTVWVSENGEISIYIDENTNGKIFFEQNGVAMECSFVSGLFYSACVDSLENIEEEYGSTRPKEHYETWTYSEVKKDSFTIVVEETTYFTKGQKIIFHKVSQ